MKNRINDLIDYIVENHMNYDYLDRKSSYIIIKAFIHEMCENQKLMCADSIDYLDENRQVILDCKNISEEL
jgi:hypothetical protein